MKSDETSEQWIERIARKKLGFSREAWPRLPEIIRQSLERSWRLGYTEKGAIARVDRYINEYDD